VVEDSGAMTLDLTADEVLTTTRSVRKRLDLTRPVPRELLLECVEIALQAPTGSNSQGWAWMFVEELGKKQAIADVYRRGFTAYRQNPRSAAYPEGDLRAQHRDAVTSSADYLSEHFHEVPVMLIPLIEGRLDGVGVVQGASAWGSILPAVWSFMLAARSRGLGTAWTTLHLANEAQTAELLGIPDGITQVALIPVAYFTGNDFKPAVRPPVEGITYWETWGATAE
jgi:nitroreductase